MKWAVALLALANIVGLLYFGLDSSQAEGPRVGLQQIEPEKIHIYTPAEIAALPKRTPDVSAAEASATQPQLACYEWGSFVPAMLSRARNMLEQKGINAETREEAATPTGNQRFWVYVPPAASQQAAQAKMRQLSALGVTDSYLVQEAPWRNAISLGIFKDEQLANKHLEDLRSIGVRSAVKGVRGAEPGQSVLVMRDITPETAASLQQLALDFAGSEFKQVNCQ